MNSSNERKFKVGDVVRLKSGGQWMTVMGNSPEPVFTKKDVACDWHNANGDGWHAYYHEDQLQFIRNDETVEQGRQYEEKIERQVEEMRRQIRPITYPNPDTFNREMPPAPPSSQEDMGPTNADGTLRSVATVQMEMNDK